MRRAIGFVIASALLVGGLYLLYIELFAAQVIVGRITLAGAFLTFLGGAWLWADYINPNRERD